MPIAARYRVSRRQLRSERPRTAPKAEGRTKRGTKGETLVVPEEASPLSAEVSATSIERRHHRQTTTRDTALISVRAAAVSARPSARSMGTANGRSEERRVGKEDRRRG